MGVIESDQDAAIADVFPRKRRHEMAETPRSSLTLSQHGGVSGWLDRDHQIEIAEFVEGAVRQRSRARKQGFAHGLWRGCLLCRGHAPGF